MIKALARAKREDKKEMRATDEDVLNQRMEAFVAGTGEQEGVDTHFQFTTAMWMKKIREKYEGAVIRRTVYSQDYWGNSITGLEPYKEHVCMIPLFDHEYEALERLAEKAVDSETFVKRFASEVSRRISLF